MRTVITLFCILLVCTVAWPQQLVTGRITDATDGTPVAGASVTVAHTTTGTTSGMSGHYSLTVPVRGSFEIVVSHAGYQPVFYRIETPHNTHQYDVALDVHELEEIVVGAAKTYSNSDVTLFWQKILGERPSRNGMQVLNAEKVYFYKSGNVLKAFCEEPIEIINHHTGYHIRYLLQSFQHDYTGNATEFYGMPFFEELVPQNSRQQNRWEKKRQEVYAVSLNHFLRAFYNSQIHEAGFFVIDPFVFENVYQLPTSDSAPVEEMEQSKVSNSYRFLMLRETQRDYQRRNQISYLLSDYQRMIETTSSATLEMVSDHVISSLTQKNTARYDQNYMQVHIEDTLILICISKPAADLKGRTASYPVMVGIPPQQFTLFSDGSYTGMMKMQEFRGNSMSLSALSSILPVEYAETSHYSSYDLTVLQSYGLEQTVTEYIAAQLAAYPQEKLHLHTDRDYYVPGERIWFKAYLTDAATHISTVQSRYVYVELISPVDTLVSRVMIRPTDDNLFYGNLFLSEIIPEGNYTLRAYTRYMENLGDDYFFKKNIRIGNLEGGNWGSRGNRESGGSRGNRESGGNWGNWGSGGNRVVGANLAFAQHDFDVSFFPEGGNLVEGAICRVAFKALNRNGTSETIYGEITDETGSVISTAQTFHAGMGVFAFYPERGKQYFLRCRNGNGTEKRFELPRPDSRTYALTVSQHKQKVLVGIQKPAGSLNPSHNPFYLLAQCRGEALYFSEWDNRKEYIVFEEEEFPAGVIQFILFDDRMNPLSERLIFNKNRDETKLEFRTDKESYDKREKVTVTISELSSLTPSLSGRAGEGLSHFSVAITDDMDIAVDSSTTILSTLLLSSELKGYIENPAYYLQDSPESTVALDYLMLTHGWRRYNIPEAVGGNPEKQEIPYQTSQEISGKATGFLSRPVVGSEIIIMSEAGDFGLTSTDERGTFRLQGFEFPDSTSFFVQALSRRGTGNVVLTVDGESFPKPVHAPQGHLTPALSKGEGESEPNAFITKAEQRSRYDEDMRVIHLSEIIVEAQKIDRKEERRLDFYVNRNSDYTIRREEIERISYNHIAQYLTTVPGLDVQFNPQEMNYYVIFNIAKVLGGGPPVILVDGVPYENMDHILPNSVESIDILKFSSASILGVRGAFGVISITTRLGGDTTERESVNSTVYTPLGYQKPVEFYSPKYETLESKHLTIPDFRTTIFWKPDIVISDEGEASFEFYTSDFTTTYSVVIEGLTDDGKIVRQVEKIRVTGLQGIF